MSEALIILNPYFGHNTHTILYIMMAWGGAEKNHMPSDGVLEASLSVLNHMLETFGTIHHFIQDDGLKKG